MNPSEQSIESVTIRNILADVSLKAYQRGIMHQPTSNIDTDPYAEKLLALVDKATRQAVIAELKAAWRRAPKDENYQPTDIITVYLRKRLEELSNKEGE